MPKKKEHVRRVPGACRLCYAEGVNKVGKVRNKVSYWHESYRDIHAPSIVHSIVFVRCNGCGLRTDGFPVNFSDPVSVEEGEKKAVDSWFYSPNDTWDDEDPGMAGFFFASFKSNDYDNVAHIAIRYNENGSLRYHINFNLIGLTKKQMYAVAGGGIKWSAPTVPLAPKGWT